MKTSKLFAALSLSLLLNGCADLTQCGMTRLDDHTLNPPKCTRKGHVFAVRGFLGIWSRGMNTISYRAENEMKVPSLSVGGVETSRLARFIVAKYNEHKLEPPIILVGHSLGADEVIDISWELYHAGIPVQLLLTTDPVMPRKIPPNVIHCYNVYKPHWTDFIPFYRGIKVEAVDKSRTYLENVNMRQFPFDQEDVTHFNIDQYIPVQDMILSQIKKELEHPVMMPANAQASAEATSTMSKQTVERS